MTSTANSGQQHWYLRFFMNPLLHTLRSIVATSAHQWLSNVPLSSGAKHWYARIVGFIGYILKMCKQILILLQRFIINPLLRSPFFILAFTSQLLRFNPKHLTPGRYALESVGQWPRRLIAFSPALFHFSVSWGQQRPRVLNRITLLAPVSASLSLFSLVALKASFLSSFLALHFSEDLNVEVIKLPFF